MPATSAPARRQGSHGKVENRVDISLPDGANSTIQNRTRPPNSYEFVDHRVRKPEHQNRRPGAKSGEWYAPCHNRVNTNEGSHKPSLYNPLERGQGGPNWHSQ